MPTLKANLVMRGRSSKPGGSRTENHNKQKLTNDFTRMSSLTQPKVLAGAPKTRLK